MIRSVGIFCLMATLLCLEPAASAADENRVFRLGEIQVSAPASENSGTGSTAVSDEDIQALNRNTVSEALNSVSGINTTRVGGRNEEMVYVRGFDLKQVPLFLDGIPIYVPYDGYVDLSRFTTFDLSEVQVSKGFASVLYGPNIMGGAINMVTSRPVKPVEAHLLGGLMLDNPGNFNGSEMSGSASVKKEKWYIRLSGSNLSRNHFRLSDEYHPTPVQAAGIRENSYSEDKRISAKVAFTPNEKDEYALSFNEQHATKGVPPYAGTDPAVSVRYWRWPTWDKKSLYWLSNSEIRGGGYFKTRAFLDWFNNALYSYDNGNYNSQTKPSSFQSFYNDSTVGGSIEGGAAIGSDNTLKGAFHYKRDNHVEHNGSEPTRKFVDDTFSVAAEDVHAFRFGLDVNMGMSFDWQKSLNADNYIAATQTIEPFPAHQSQAFNSQLGLVYHLNATDSLHASVSRRSRFPKIKERYSYRLGSALPNPDLKAEKVLAIEVGTSILALESLRIDVAVFDDSITDAIQSVTVSPNVTQNQNVGHVVSRGAEVGIRTFIIPKTEVGSSYTFLHRSNVSDPSVVPTDTPEHKWFTFAKYRPTERFLVVPSLEVDSSRVVRSDGQTTGGFLLANLKFGYDVTDWFTAEAGVNNLTDRNFEIASGFPEEGRNYFVNARCAF